MPPALPCAPRASRSGRPASRGTTCRGTRPSPRIARTCPGPRGRPAARRGARGASLVAPLGEVDVLEGERLLVRPRGGAHAFPLPGGRVGEAGIVALRLAVGGLVLLAEMPAAGFLALQGVLAHQLGELHEVRHAPGAFQRLIQVLAPAPDEDVGPEPLAQLLDR